MGLFGRKINARVREQVKRIFSTTTGSDTGDMSQASEQVGSSHKAISQNIPSIIKVDKKKVSPVVDPSSTKYACASRASKCSKQSLQKKRQTDPFEGEQPVFKSGADSLSRPSELGDVKLSSKSRRIKNPPFSSFPFCNDGKSISSSSHSFNWRNKKNNVCKSYSEIHQGTERDWKRYNKNYSLDRSRRDICPWSGNRLMNNLDEKQKTKPKHPHSRTRHYDGESSSIDTMQQVSYFRYKQNLPRKVVHLNERRIFPEQKQLTDVSDVKPLRGCDSYQVRQSTFQCDHESNRLKKDANEKWSVKSLSLDTSTGISKVKKVTSNHRGIMRNRTKAIKLGFVVRRNDRWNGNGFQQTQNSSRRELEQVAMVHNSSCVTPNVKSESDQPNSFISGKKSPIYVFKKADSSPTVSKNCTSPNANDNRASLKPTKDHENQAPNSVEVFCSKGTFDINSNEKACICTKVEQMTTLQAGSVLYEWHTTEQKALNGKVVVGTELAPALVDFEPMSPMKMSTGGQGTVVWVHLPSTSMQYALKFKARDGRSEKNWLVERREAKILQKLKHPFIVNTYHIYETDAALFMAFEYLSGGCLWGHIARIGTLPECYAIYYAACILTALSYLHTRGIVYRDMKAENVVLDYRNRPKLIDFGMAKYFPSVRKQMQLDGDSVKKIHPEYPLGKEFIHVPQLNWASPDLDTDIGTDDPPTRYYYAAYLAPEIYNQPAEANHYIDSWGLGYIILEMILGYGIFLPIPWANIKGQHLSPDWHLHLPIEVVEKLTTDCRNIVYKMLVRQPQKRLSLKSAMRHAFFSRVPWPSLQALTGPDLSRFCNSEDFYQQRLALNSLDFHFGRWSKYYTSKKFYNPHVNSTNHFKLRSQCGKDNEDSLSQRNRNKRLSKHIDTCRKASVSNNHGISCTNRKIGNQQDIHLRFRGEVINGPRTVDLLKKKQGKKQQSM